MRRVADILVSSCRSGDATSAHVFDVARCLLNAGWHVNIFVNGLTGHLPADIRPITRHLHPGDYEPAADLVIVEYAVWFPLAERLRDVKAQTIFWYHGVTPPELWGTDVERDILQRSQIGAELAWYAHLAVVDSPYSACELSRNSEYPLERVHVTPLSVDIASFRTPPAPSVLTKLRRQWNLQDKRILLYAGRLAGNKRLDLLIDAMVKLVFVCPDAHLLIVGDDSSAVAHRQIAAELRARVEALGMTASVTFTGRVAQIEPYYHLADVYVTASQHECFGAPLIEAMAAGLPVVASASGAMPWVLNAEGAIDEAAGLVFPEGDVDALVEKLTSVMGDTRLREALVARGYQRVEQFSREVFARNVSHILEKVAQIAQAGPPLGFQRSVPPLVRQADVSLRSYRVRSNAPFVGRAIEWIRYNMTTHVKEAYVDRIIEQQVLYNRVLAQELLSLREEVAYLREQVQALSVEKKQGSQ